MSHSLADGACLDAARSKGCNFCFVRTGEFRSYARREWHRTRCETSFRTCVLQYTSRDRPSHFPHIALNARAFP